MLCNYLQYNNATLSREDQEQFRAFVCKKESGKELRNEDN